MKGKASKRANRKRGIKDAGREKIKPLIDKETKEREKGGRGLLFMLMMTMIVFTLM